MSDCERCRSLLDSYIDHALEESERLFVEKHLEQCADCQLEWQEAQALAAQLAIWAAEEIEPPADFREKLFTRLDAEPAPIVPLAARAQKKKPRWGKVLPWAAVAVLLLALLPAITHIAGDRPENASQPQQVADNDQPPAAEDQDVQPRALAETEPAEEVQPKEQQPSVVKKEDAPKLEAPAQNTDSGQQKAGSNQKELTSPHNDTADNTVDDKTPMLASGQMSEDQQAPTGDTQEKMPFTASYRSAAPVEPDWAALKEQDTALMQQYNEELEQLKQQYAETASETLKQAIADKEAALKALEQRLAAIEQKDVEAYEAALEKNE